MATPQLIHTTPVKPRLVVFRLGLVIPGLKTLRELIDKDMRAFWIGLLSPAEFIKYFMDDPKMATPDAKFPSVAGMRENDMYQPIVSHGCPSHCFA